MTSLRRSGGPARARLQGWLTARHDCAGLEVPRWAGVVSLGLCTAVTVAALFTESAPPRWAAAMIVAPLAVSTVSPRLPRWVADTVAAAGAAVLVGSDSAALGLMLLYILPGEAAFISGLLQGLVVWGVSAAWLLNHAVSDLLAHRPTGWYLSFVGCSISWVVGRVARHQVQTVAALRSAHRELAHQAASEERQRIAREVHDLIGHSLSATMLHVTGARLAIDHDPEEARRALLEAERLGRDSLAEIRRTVGLLRRDDDPAGTAPVPTAVDVTDLVDGWRRRGIDVGFAAGPGLDALPPPVGFAVYRIVQESLSNVARHAPASAVTVEVTPAGSEATVAVRSVGGRRPVQVTEPGHGIVGMTERATLLGGWLRAGPTHDGWLVEARLPYAAPA